MKKNDPNQIKPKKRGKVFTVLFVCSGNSCRSPLAKGIFDKIIKDNPTKTMKITSLSAGTTAVNGQLPSENAQTVANKLGIDIQNHLSTRLTKECINMADLILTMQEKHKNAVLELAPAAKNKTYIITEYVGINNKRGINDPLGQSVEKYYEVAQELNKILFKVYNKIITSRR